MPSPLGGGPAPIARRGAACLVDLAIAGVLGGTAAAAAEWALASAGSGDALIEPFRKLLLVGVHAGYCVLMTAGSGRSTFGQRWFGLQVLGAQGGRPTPSEAFARWVAFVTAAVPLGAGLLLALGPDRRPFQDRICDSRVVAGSVRAAGQAA
jgi:uncharacterized RDD family membrane protein YckC